MIEELKLYLGEAANNYSDQQLKLFLNISQKEVENYCNCSIDSDLEFIVLQIAVIKLNRQNTEGLTAQGFSGVSESYIDGYPKEIQNVLNSKRKIKLF